MTPDPSRSFRARLGAIPGPWRGILGYLGFTLAVFVVALLYGLPHDLIARRALGEATSEAPMRVVFDDVSFAFPNGYHFTEVRLSPRDDPQYTVEVPEITVRTPLTGILLGRIDSATFSGRLYGGTFEGTAETSDGKVATTVSLEEVRLAPLTRRFLPPPGAVAGTASLDLALTGDGRSTRSSAGTVELSARNVSLEGIIAQGITVPDLTFSDVQLEAEVQGTRLQLERFTARGDELTLGATGDVLVREPASQSVLNLQLEIDVSAEARPGLRVATSLLPKRKTGQKSWALRGSLASPSLR